jgi:hypothetical protein
MPIVQWAVEEYLAPIIMTMGTREVDKRNALDRMRMELRRTYGEFAEIVLNFMLETYRP